MKYLTRFVLAAAAIGCGETPSKEVALGDPADEIRIVYQGRLDGEFEPCG